MRSVLLPSFTVFLLALAVVSCHEKEIKPIEIQFSLSSDLPTSTSTGGRIKSTNVTSVLVTIKNASGGLIADRRKLVLQKFGESYLSVPLTLSSESAGKFFLSEFLVLDEKENALYATPKAGSKYAHLVKKPLDIEFTVSKDQITTVTPEVLAVDETSIPSDYGYGQFGFKVVDRIQAVFSSFIKGDNNFELTGSHLKIEALQDSVSSNSLWLYETDLDPKARIVTLIKSNYYRITATKSGYAEWKKTIKLKNGEAIEMIFETKLDEYDVYVLGTDDGKMVYWKNGTKVKISDEVLSPRKIFVSKGDIYAAANESQPRAFYFKNSEKIILDQTGFITDIAVSGNDVHLLGMTVESTNQYPAYWKNKIYFPLNGTGKYALVTASAMALDGSDIYIGGTEGPGTSYEHYPILWKNGVPKSLPTPTGSINTRIASIKIENGHVFACGTTDDLKTKNKIIVWKDHTIEYLSDSGVPTWSNSMAVSNAGIHIIGAYISYGLSFNEVSAYWLNGINKGLESGSNFNTVQFSEIAVASEKIGIAGRYNGYAAVWLNGDRIVLGTKFPSITSSIFLVKNN